jgi:hypothetical protein
MKRIELIANIILQIVLTVISLGVFAAFKYCDMHVNSGDHPYLIWGAFLFIALSYSLSYSAL